MRFGIMIDISRVAAVVVGLGMQALVAGAFISPSSAPTPGSVLSRLSSLKRPIGTCWGRRRRRTYGVLLPASRPRLKRGEPTMLFDKRPEEQALGDRFVSEAGPAGGGDGEPVGGVSLEPPGFLKRLFSVPKNVRKTAAVLDVVVPVIGARDGWGGIRQSLANRGVYPGVEYRILEISLDSETESASESKSESSSAVFLNDGAPSSSSSSPSSTSGLLTSAREAPEEAFDEGNLVFTMRPVYPLIKRLERTWPVRVPAREFPVLLTPFSYNAATAWAALTTSLSLLAVGFVLSQALTFSVIPSHSMEPTLQVGDVVLVEKLSRASFINRDDIIFFNPPPVLREVVAAAGGTLNSRDLFVKRVAALPGDTVNVNPDGSVEVEIPSPGKAIPTGPEGTVASGAVKEGAAATEPQGGTKRSRRKIGAKVPLPDNVLERVQVADGKVLPRDTVFVLGDNPAASMDSRVWGELDEREIVGHALFRVFPPKVFGLLQ